MSSPLTLLSDPPEELLLAQLSSLLEVKPEALATGDKDIQLAALQAAKFVFDNGPCYPYFSYLYTNSRQYTPALQTESKSRAQLVELLSSISPTAAPQTRSQTAAANGKRKRVTSPPPAFSGPQPQETLLSELSVEGMDEDQIWAQLELRAANICDILEYALETTGEMPESDNEKENGGEGEDEDVDMDRLDEMEDSEEAEDDEDSEDEDDEDEDDGFEDEDLGEGVTNLRDPSDDEPSSDIDLDKPPILSGGKRTVRIKPRKGGHSELDDGFFDLAAFNAETEEAESRAVSRGRLGRDSDDEDGDNAEEDVDYFAAVDDEAESDLGENQGASNVGVEVLSLTFWSYVSELFYKDFFEPLVKVSSKSRKGVKLVSTSKVRFHEQVRVKNIKAKGKSLPLSTMYAEGDDGENEDDDSFDDGGGMDVDEDEDAVEVEDDSEGDEGEGFGSRLTMDRFKDDLFANDEEENSNDGR